MFASLSRRFNLLTAHNNQIFVSILRQIQHTVNDNSNNEASEASKLIKESSAEDLSLANVSQIQHTVNDNSINDVSETSKLIKKSSAEDLSLSNVSQEMVTLETIATVKRKELLVDDFIEEDLIDKTRPKSVTQICEPLDLSTYGRALKPTFNVAAYAEKSELIQKLTDLGVQWYKFEHKKDIMEYLLKLKFEDVAPYISFLHDHGVHPDNLGNVLTLNPYILQESLENLKIRINYLESKNFTEAMIANILNDYPKWFSYTVKKIDEKLGYYQTKFLLKGHQVRLIFSKAPALIYKNKEVIEIINFIFVEEMGANPHEIKAVLVHHPEVFLLRPRNLVATFDVLNDIMRIPRANIFQQAECLLTNHGFLRKRHKFLTKLGRAQYNPRLPGYVSLTDISSTNDFEFCENIAKSSTLTYEVFLKTL